MKLSTLFSGIIGMILLISCDKTDILIPQDQTKNTKSQTQNINSSTLQNAQVIKNCLGSFLEIENKLYLVCNENLVQNYPDKSQVQVTLSRQLGCLYSGTCYMHLDYEYSVEILSIQ